MVSVATTDGARLFQRIIVLGKKHFRASLYALGLRYCELCDALVDLVLWDGVKYLSLSIEIVPQWILWKETREDWFLWASRVGHCSSSSISSTLLELRHLLQVQRDAVLCTFSTPLLRDDCQTRKFTMNYITESRLYKKPTHTLQVAANKGLKAR